MRFLGKTLPVAMGLAAFSGMAVGLPPAARAVEIVDSGTAVHVAVKGVQSQAQLASQLQSQGFQEVRLSELYPNPAQPRPDLTAPSTDHLDAVPVHDGWNGSAVRNGTTYFVYANIGNAGLGG